MNKRTFYTCCKGLLLFAALILVLFAVRKMKSEDSVLTETAVSDQLTAEDRMFLENVIWADLSDTGSVQQKAETKKILQLAEKASSPELKGKVYCVAGEYNLYRNNYRTALKMLKKAVKTCPEFYGDPQQSSAQNLIETCYIKISLAVIKRVVEFVLGALILIVIALYIITKPWRWFTAKHLVAVLSLMLAAIFMFLLINHFTGKTVSLGSEYFSKPVFSNEQMRGFGGKISASILRFYITGVVGIILAMIPLSRIRFKFTKTALSLLLSLIVFPSIIGLFCFRQSGSESCFSTFIFRANTESRFPYLTGKWYWVAKDFKPYVISNPRKFMNLNVDLINEPAFKTWLVDKYSKINSSRGNDETKTGQ